MNLPRIDSPVMTMTIPSTGLKVKYTNFTVKEQKAILLAAESEDQDIIVETITRLLNHCVEGHDFEHAPLYDLEYAFAKLRTSSVGGIVQMKHTCDHEIDGTACGTSNDVTINIEDMKLRKITKEESLIKISDKQYIELKHLGAHDALSLVNKKLKTEQLYDVIAKSIKLIIDDDNVIEVTYGEELIKWCDDLPDTTVGKVLEFVKNTPRTEMQLKYVCSECEHEHDVNIVGLESFL